MRVFAVYAIALLAFHSSEFLLACRFNPSDVGPHSLLLTWPYVAAQALSAAEFLGEAHLFPAAKATRLARAVSFLGLALVVTGEALRKAGVLTAGRHFTHLVQATRRPGHLLITGGVYGLVRHPGYLGFVLWALGTQLLLCNAVSVFVFYLALRRFFKGRVAFEESRLERFFGDEWRAYKQRTPACMGWLGVT